MVNGGLGIAVGATERSLLTFSDGLQPAGDTKRLTFENRGATSPAWAADGHEIVFYAPGGLWRIARPWAHGKDRQAATTSLFRRKRRQARHLQSLSFDGYIAGFGLSNKHALTDVKNSR